ncbi:hypothetical protein [Acinetobacter sp.]|uniref:hypothetical protein n=1 Tax=Acinetobacter sp. TaxID=472 RepID=UPI003D03BAB3
MDKYYHISHRDNLTELKPWRGEVYFTDKEHIHIWKTYTRTKHIERQKHTTLFLYEIELADDTDIYIGVDGERLGDYYIQTRKPVTCRLIKHL